VTGGADNEVDSLAISQVKVRNDGGSPRFASTPGFEPLYLPAVRDVADVSAHNVFDSLFVITFAS
jgi:hypothetical protein